MRGRTTRQITFLGVSPDELIPANHPIRRVDPARAPAQGCSADGLLLDSQRAPVL